MDTAKRSFYLFSSGRLSRKDNSLAFISEDGQLRYIPVEITDALYVYGQVDVNSAALDFLGSAHIPVHFFSYYGYYRGSFYPTEYLLAGEVLTAQVKHYLDLQQRLYIASELLMAATHNIVRNLSYYNTRGMNLQQIIDEIEVLRNSLQAADSVSRLMAAEGNIRDLYYGGFDSIMKENLPFGKRMRQPPGNEINALISFGNSLCYATTLGEIYRTPLNPTVSYLHEPSERRYSLALDLSEIFKPLLVDRVIFRMVNTHQLTTEDFESSMNGCYLKETGRRAFVTEYENKLKTTIQHRRLKRNVSYRSLIRLEAYKLVKHVLGEQQYEGLRLWF